jgi:hypothetical protein
MVRDTRLEHARLVIRGVRSELRVEDGHVTITKEVPTRAEPSTVTVPVDTIRAASVKAPSRGNRGWLHLAVLGGSPPPPTELAAANDPYTLPISSRSSGPAKRLVRLVERHVRKRGMPSEQGPNEGRYSSSVSITRSGSSVRSASAATDRPAGPDAGQPNHPPAPSRQRPRAEDMDVYMRELDDLHAAGALTDEEVERAKARLLG